MALDLQAASSFARAKGERRPAEWFLGGLIALAIAVRLVPILVSPSVVWGDEIFQTTEQAHRLVYGTGLVPWEFALGIRSWLMPGAIAALMEVARLIGDGPDYYLPVIAVAFAAIAALPVFCVFRWCERAFGLSGAILGGLIVAIDPELVYFGARTLAEVVAGHLLIVAIYLLELEPSSEPAARRRCAAAGALLGLILALRLQLAPALGLVALWTTWRSPRERFWPLVGGAVLVLCFSGMLDAVTLGYPFASLWRYLDINLFADVSSLFGVLPWNYYLSYELSVWQGAVFPLAALVLIGALRRPLLLATAAVIVASHSAIAHKEIRFIYPAMVLLGALAAIGFAQVGRMGQGALSRRRCRRGLFRAVRGLCLLHCLSRLDRRIDGHAARPHARGSARGALCRAHARHLRHRALRAQGSRLGRVRRIHLLPAAGADLLAEGCARVRGDGRGLRRAHIERAAARRDAAKIPLREMLRRHLHRAADGKLRRRADDVDAGAGATPGPRHGAGAVTAVIAQLRTGAWLDRERLVGYCLILFALELATFLFMVAGTHGLIVPLAHPTTTDFVSFYGAGVLANHGTPALAYDQAAHYAIEQQIRGQGIPYQFFYYPPVFLLLCSVLARLPYLVAFLIFETATLALFLAAGCAIAGERRLRVLLPLAAFPCVFWTFGLGQNAFLSAALFAAATLLVDRRPVAAGLLFGALCYKPHIGLLIPVALAAAGRWRAFAAAAAAVSALALVSLDLYGWDSWRDFLAAAGQSPGTYEAGRIDFAGFVSPFGAIRLLGGGTDVAYIAQAVATVAAGAFVALVWRRSLELPTRAAALAAATLVAAPVLLIYDFLLAAVAALWLVRGAREHGWLPWERTTLAALFVTPLLGRNVAASLHLPVLPLAALALVAVVAARARHEIARRTADGASRHIVRPASSPAVVRVGL